MDGKQPVQLPTVQRFDKRSTKCRVTIMGYLAMDSSGNVSMARRMPVAAYAHGSVFKLSPGMATPGSKHPLQLSRRHDVDAIPTQSRCRLIGTCMVTYNCGAVGNESCGS